MSLPPKIKSRNKRRQIAACPSQKSEFVESSGIPGWLPIQPWGGSNSLRLIAQATLPPGASEISWDFGDGSARQSGAGQQHMYAKQ
jgi:hypothetical protein